MFPLGTVLLPSALLPLHLFEPRYLAMISDCVATRQVPDTVEALLAVGDEPPSWSNHNESRPFGVVLIERGSEVGGDDTRSRTGCLAEILEARQLDDGRWHVIGVGTRRFSVRNWLEDDPYPLADIDVLPEPTAGPGDDELQASVEAHLVEVGALARRLNRGSLPEPDVAADPALASFQLAAVGPLGPLDRQRVLAAQTPNERLTLLAKLYSDIAADLQAELGNEA